MVTQIYLIRHAEAEGNVKEFFQGNVDTPLTEKGEQQLECLVQRFAEIPLDAIYTSPFQRAKLTAEAVGRGRALSIEPEYELREINGGEWEGRTWAEIPRLFPRQYELWTHKMWLFAAPHGDTMTDVYYRMQETMKRIAEENAGKTVAVISHGCAVRNFLAAVEFGNISGLADVGWADNTAVSLVEYDNARDKWTLIFKNDSSHLPPELSTLRKSQWSKYEEGAES